MCKLISLSRTKPLKKFKEPKSFMQFYPPAKLALYDSINPLILLCCSVNHSTMLQDFTLICVKM